MPYSLLTIQFLVKTVPYWLTGSWQQTGLQEYIMDVLVNSNR